MELIGRSIIGYKRGAETGVTLRAINPATREPLDPPFQSATSQEVDLACRLAASAFEEYRHVPGRAKAAFLRRIAAKIEGLISPRTSEYFALGPQLVDRATIETGLPAGRIQSETARTANQLRMFANLIEEGSWVDARIDRAQADRRPIPAPDVRSMLRPLGPVVVFGASNFPLAFSVAGGDTASALAAGNTVVVNAHYAHPGTAEMVGLAIADAARECRLPEGVFSLVYGAGLDVGKSLVEHPSIKAVAFTGSRAGGRALMSLIAARPEPIPFYAEMSSINPVFILPGALEDRGSSIAAGLQGSVTLGSGQFCTKPGVVVLKSSADAAAFGGELANLMAATPLSLMLTPGIHDAYFRAIASLERTGKVTEICRQSVNSTAAGLVPAAALFQTDATTFLAETDLSAEVFGPCTLLVTHSDREQLLEIARGLEGHLTATIHGTEADLAEYADLIEVLENKVGRLVFNGFPTGVEVCHAMVHGGPFPATSDGRSTSVGTRAILRFARPVCYQGFPDARLPEELKNENPLGIERMVDGRATTEPIS
jgi:alpha-ketoglutaric semialdehyde dehydrogenase